MVSVSGDNVVICSVCDMFNFDLSNSIEGSWIR